MSQVLISGIPWEQTLRKAVAMASLGREKWPHKGSMVELENSKLSKRVRMQGLAGPSPPLLADSPWKANGEPVSHYRVFQKNRSTRRFTSANERSGSALRSDSIDRRTR